jgi:RNA 2',3'-cyclic 3'-phosphodiesterase
VNDGAGNRHGTHPVALPSEATPQPEATSPATMRRLFVAAWPGDAFRAELADVFRALRSTGASVRWVPAGNLHVTLRFLGDVESSRVAELTRVLEDALRNVAAFPVRLAGFGVFPSRGVPHVFWAGFGDGARELAALARIVERALLPGGFVPVSERPFRAHVTLGRSRGPRGLERLVTLAREWSPKGGAHTLAEVRLVESRLTPRGAVYAPVARFPLVA